MEDLQSITTDTSLHPNMFLLNPSTRQAYPLCLICFTSQYVSIKSHLHPQAVYQYLSLHPNMFLLNRHFLVFVAVYKLSLHPNMFLLNRILPESNQYLLFFTSQYVSIKSVSRTYKIFPASYFTSQYVSIKSAVLISL